ncbi:chemotaxis protein [Sulfurospirillum sp. 1307]|jgi:hypothetical protein
MTQEELDALMAGGLDEEDTKENEELASSENVESEEENVESTEDILGDEENITPDSYRASADMAWPPPPPTDDHKMVYQLDDVTKDSEAKAGEVFDKLESINSFMMEAEENANEVIALIESNIELFSKLCEKFPKIAEFQKALEDNKEMKDKVEKLIESAQSAEDEVMMTMDIMQYQDIHRQKIERVINVMRALSKYMSHLFEGKVEDEKRVGSAVHIHGDESTENIVTNDDIEELIANLGKK